MPSVSELALMESEREFSWSEVKLQGSWEKDDEIEVKKRQKRGMEPKFGKERDEVESDEISRVVLEPAKIMLEENSSTALSENKLDCIIVTLILVSITLLSTPKFSFFALLAKYSGIYYYFLLNAAISSGLK